MADRRIYAGYYRRYNGKMIYVVTMVKDADTDEDTVIWTPTIFSEKRAYGLNRGSVDHLQWKSFTALAQALKERDDADGRRRLHTKIGI